MGQEVIGRVVWKHSPSPLLFPFDPWLYRRYISLFFKCAHIVFSLSNLLLYSNWIQKRKKTLSTVHKTWYEFDYGRNSLKNVEVYSKRSKNVFGLCCLLPFVCSPLVILYLFLGLFGLCFVDQGFFISYC